MQYDQSAHVAECIFYGVRPLSDAEVARMQREGLQGLESAFSIASDLNAGFTWGQAKRALKRSIAALD